MFVEISNRPAPRRAALLSSLLASLVAFAPPARAETPEAVARAVLRDLSAGKAADVAARFGPRMAAALPAPRLEEVWTALVAQAGAVKGVGAARTAAVNGGTAVTLPITFERMALDMRVVVGADGKLLGLRFVPPEPAPETWSAPAYASPASFREEEVTVGKAPWALPGTLTLPAGKTKVPAVVLVQGSGPHDRDETIGPNRPFRDLAWGLASRGIAVLRYEKRTRAHGDAMAGLADLTVREEVTDDARAAVALLRARPEVDPARVVLLGHSLGGTLAPRIAREEPGIAALVILAGATRPIPELMVEQTEYLLGLGGVPKEEARAKLAAMKADAARASAARPGDPPVLGAPASYWADLNAYDPAATAAALPVPILVLQGGRDYQVGAADLAGWRRALAARPRAVIRTFPELNHLFEAGEGKSTPAEYERPGHVDVRAVEEIARFVLGLGGK